MRTNRPHQWADEEDNGADRRRSRQTGKGRQPMEYDEYGVRTDRPVYHPAEQEEAPARGKRRSVRKRVLGLLLAAVVLIASAGGVYLWTMFGRVNYDTGSLPLPQSTVGTVYDPSAYAGDRVADLPLMGDTDDVTNILLMGIDSEDFEGRADTNILLSINTRDKTIKMASLMRDTWVTLPGVDNDYDGWDDDDRLNAAYSTGGISLHLQMIEQNFRLHIDKYIAVNFDVFPKVVDAMGGVTVEMTGAEAGRVPASGSAIRYGGAGYVPMGTDDGAYHMDGFQALQYARIRYLDADGDFSRTARQRKLISRMIDEAGDMGLSQLHTALYDALPEVRTNMSRATLMGLTVRAVGYRSYTVDTSYRVPQDGMWENASLYGMSVLRLTDPVGSVADLHRYLYGEEDEGL